MEYNTGKKQSFFAGQSDLLIKNIKGYVETKVEIAKLEARSEAGNIISLMISHLGGAFMVAFGVVFLLIALAFLIGRSLGYDWGFAIVGFVFLGIAAVYYYNFKHIEKYINVMADNQLKAISERENAAEEAMEDPKEAIKTPLPAETVIQQPIPRNVENLRDAELNHLELEDNEDLRPIQSDSFEPNRPSKKTVFAPEPKDQDKDQ